ncbi:MAG: hypothetical protein HZA53_11055 [Planctomycetes bacterium]|nr:hypothetical protein [Planctomycetota bacterium]
MNRSSWFAFLPALAVSITALASHAGEGGCQPEDGTYTLHRTDPPPAADVAAGKFGGGDMDLYVSGFPTQQWRQGEDGQYRPVDPDGRSVCFHDGTPITYEYKLNGTPVSSGELQP